jgi:N-acetylneuraminate synthase
VSAPTRIIAEAGVNHDGSEERAMALVDAAADAGADTVKFQTFDPDALVSASAPQAAYQTQNTGRTESQRAMLSRLVLSHAAHARIQAHCQQRGIGFLSTPFDLASLEFLVDTLRLTELKIGSGDLTNAPLLLRAAQHGTRLILSTGMATLDDIEAALGVVAFGYRALLAGAPSGVVPSRVAFSSAFAEAFEKGDTTLGRVVRERVSLLHCTSAYPAPMASLHLRAMDTMAARFPLAVGYSDHSLGLTAVIAAVARGARVVEKHLTLDSTLPGPDHAASLDPTTFRALVAAVRDTEAALGDPQKSVQPTERDVRHVARKSLFTRRAVRTGEPFSEESLTTRRPGTGITAMDYFDWIGTPSPSDLADDTMIPPTTDADAGRTA